MEEQIVKKEKETLIFNIIVRFAVFFVVLIFLSFHLMKWNIQKLL